MSIQEQHELLKEEKISKPSIVEAGENYRYKQVNLRLFLDDMKFSKNAPVAGDLFPAFNLTTTEGRHLTNSNVFGNQIFKDKPVLFIFGSMTCPMTMSSMPSIKKLQREFGDQIEFVLVQGREAHPGEKTPQPETMAEKQQHALTLKGYFDIDWTVATDSIEGDLHRALDPKPNLVYLVGNDSRILFRSIWAGDIAAIHRALAAVAAGQPLSKKQSVSMVGPMARAMGHVDATIKRGGRMAVRDMWRVAFPVVLAGRIATLFSPLSPNQRGVAAVLTILLSLAAITFIGVYVFV